MTRIELTARQTLTCRISAFDLRMNDWAGLPTIEIQKQLIHCCQQPIELGEWFDVASHDDAMNHLSVVWSADCGRIDHLGVGWRHGLLVVHGNVGHACGACMTGGRIEIDGNAGDQLGSAIGSRGTGINGGVLIVSGNAGNDAGQRMRRGELYVRGSAGDGMGSLMYAGTIGCGGNAGQRVGIGMRRGTIILPSPSSINPLSHGSTSRFTEPRLLTTPFQTILAHRRWTKNWIGDLIVSRRSVCRGDLTVGGQGEVWF
ncbi:MAG: formylmethanofuran dehydrogenase subunit C [Planctomycetota bacterium]